ncbi:glyoxalase [Asanoa ishikariensis]|uniref:VOC domain-containing protein n=1 Tax=Asanoa ishikariensis TaxID=137265 RepID=A0A1H3RRN4_9ACTN|nr:VOC family protein [Asanoa ishikariensis]GIF66904.1 glyoxalase [Asanoa ishikariensis]SDZ28366.1 hypothetical protein SAMN05421684_4142 [Asanoa ishikariensis]
MTNRIHHLNIDSRDPYELAGWWSKVLGYPRSDEDFPGDPEALLIAPEGTGPSVLFCQISDEKTTKNRLHFDLQPTERTRDEEVERLLGIGATLVGDLRRPDGTGWVTLADPEGNEFCVERSAAERA